MPVTFDRIPTSSLVPAFYAEVSASAAATRDTRLKTLLVGTAGGSPKVPTGVPIRVTSVAEARDWFGNGTELPRMYETYRRNDPFTEVWALPLARPSGMTFTTRRVEFSGTATSNGRFTFYLFGDTINLPVETGDTANEVAARLTSRINSAPHLAVSASNTGPVALVIAKVFGGAGNMTTAQMADYVRTTLSWSGENKLGYPAGLTVTTTDGVSGAGDTVGAALTAAIAAMGDDTYDYVVYPYSQTAELTTWKDALNDQTGWWAPNRLLYGHFLGAMNTTAAAADTLTDTLNSQHMTIMAFRESNNSPEQWAAAYAGQTVLSIGIKPSRPLQTLPLEGIRSGKKFTSLEKNTYLYAGMSMYNVVGSAITITRLITTYKQNVLGEADLSYKDLNTLAQLQFVLRGLQFEVESRWPRHILVDDVSDSPGQNDVVSPAQIRGVLISLYDQWALANIVENPAAFAQNLVVERDRTDPNRVNVYFPPGLANQLRIFAVHAAFRLQYPQVGAGTTADDANTQGGES